MCCNFYGNRIDLNENKDVFKDLNDVSPSDYWFPYEYIDDEVKKKVEKTKGQFTGDKMEKETKNYMESLNHNPNWLKKITIKLISSLSIMNTLTSSLKRICKGEKTTVLLHPSEN